MQVCTSLQTDNLATTPQLSFYRPDAIPAANQQRQSTEGEIQYILILYKVLAVQNLPATMFSGVTLCDFLLVFWSKRNSGYKPSTSAKP